MAIASVNAPSASPDPLERLRLCRLALAGIDEAGSKVHPGMFDAGVLSLAHGDGTRRPPPEALKACVEALLDPDGCALDDYLFLQRFEPLERRISKMFLAGRIRAEAANNICVECGTVRLFGSFMYCATKPGDLFLAAPTYYHSLPDWCARFGVTLACVQTLPEHGYKLTVPALEAWYADNVATGRQKKPKGLFLFNPTQTGGIYSSNELAEIARFVRAENLIVLADHVFAGTEFFGSPSAAFLAAEDGMAERVVTVGGVSKSHNLANIRIGWACGPQDLIDAMRQYSVSTIISVPRLNMRMALGAIDVDPAYLALNASECESRADLIHDLVDTWNREIARSHRGEAPFHLVHRPLSGHSLLLSCRPLEGKCWPGGVIRNNVDVTRFFLSEANVAVSPGFSSGLDGCEVRLCFGSVGLSKTYDQTAGAEMRAVTIALQNKAAERGFVDIQMTTVSLNSHDEHPGDQHHSFSHGREMIRSAMVDRMLPAILRLYSHQRAPAAIDASSKGRP